MEAPICVAPESERATPRSKRFFATFTVRAAARTDCGKVRPSNEDRELVSPPVALRYEGLSTPVCSRLLAVADGMGGHTGGARASAIAVRTLSSTFLPIVESLPSVCPTSDQLDACVLAELRHSIERAHALLREEAASDPTLAHMGTTLTLAYIHGSRLFVAHAGDSRCYLLRGGQLSQVTRDHTLVNELIRSGFLESADDVHASVRNVLINALGGTDEPVKVETHRIQLRAGDVILLCTDGLTGMVTDSEIFRVLNAYTEPQRAADHLVSMANAKGGTDNITAIVARCEEGAGCE